MHVGKSHALLRIVTARFTLSKRHSWDSQWEKSRFERIGLTFLHFNETIETEENLRSLEKFDERRWHYPEIILIVLR
jgi:hypothetical protein